MRTIAKSLAARLLAPLMAAGLVLACSGSSGPAGTYALDKDAMKAVMEAEMANQPGGDEMEAAVAEMMTSMLESMSFTMTINDDGTFDLKGSGMGEAQDQSGTWATEGDRIKLMVEGEDPAYAVVTDEGLRLEFPGEDAPEIVLLRQ